MSKIAEAKAALQKAMDALDAVDAEETSEGEDNSPEGDDDDMPVKSLQMKLGKYKD
jgi:hypothetical protein